MCYHGGYHLVAARKKAGADQCLGDSMHGGYHFWRIQYHVWDRVLLTIIQNESRPPTKCEEYTIHRMAIHHRVDLHRLRLVHGRGVLPLEADELVFSYGIRHCLTIDLDRVSVQHPWKLCGTTHSEAQCHSNHASDHVFLLHQLLDIEPFLPETSRCMVARGACLYVYNHGLYIEYYYQ